MKRALKLKRFIASVLIFTLMFTGIQWNYIVNAAGEEPYIKKELTEYRSEYTKTYLKSNGELESVVSSHALHFRNEKGKWEEIDQSLVLKEKDGIEVYETKNSPLTVSFPAETDSSNAVTISAGGDNISIELLENKKSKAEKKENKNNSKKSDRPKSKMIASEIMEQDLVTTSAIEYPDVYDNTDIRYDVTAGALKESVIIKEQPKGNTTYKYNIKADGLEAELLDNGQIEFYESGNKAEPVFTMPAPLMFDSENEYSYDIEVKLKNKKGAYELSYTPSKEWLRDESRAYPVTLDPSIVVNSGIDDSYTHTDVPNSYYGFEKQLKVGNSAFTGTNGTFDTYIRFNELPQIPVEKYTLDSALLMMTPKYFDGSWTEMSIGAFEITEDWSNNYFSGIYLNYGNRPASSDMSFSTATFLYNNIAPVGFEIANLVEKWYAEPENNHGVRLSAVSATDNPWNSIAFNSSRSETGSPYLSITYTPIIDATGITIINRPEDDVIELMSSLPPYKFEAAFAPENATPEEVVWESSDTEVADIANDGTVWPHKTGITTISVKLKDRQEIRDSFALSFVNTPLESLTIKGRPKDDTIVRTYGVQLSADIYPLNASVDKIEWTSSNPEIATVDKNGYCTGVSGGTTTITAKAGNVTASFQLTVRLFYVDFAKYPYEMIIGETDTYSPVISPYEDKEVIVTSSNPEVAKVNQESKSIYACGAGTTTIRIELAEDSSYYSEYTLTVESDEYNFYKPDNDILKVGDSWKFIDDPKANISIGNQDLAEITSHGVLKALKPGDIVIEHWKGDRSGFGRYELTITPTAVTIDGRPNNNQMKVGDIHPGMSISTSNSYDESIEWSSSNENVATVDCDFLNGVRIFAHNEGVTRISAYDPEYKVTVSFILTVSAKKVENVEIRKIDPDSVDTILLTEKIRLGGYVTPVDATYDKVDWLPQSINGGQVTLMPTEGINQNRTIDVRGDHTGQVKITAYAGGMASAPYILTIIEMTVKITNKPSNNNLNVGQTHQLGKEVYPSDANISWHSSNKNVAQIDSTGKITALSSGSTTIWVEATKDGVDINDTNAFTLTVETLNIKNRPENDTLYVGQTHTVTLSSNFIVPEWHSSSRQIAKVDENGKITTQRTGKVEIYAVYNNEKYWRIAIASCNSFDK